MVNEQHFKNKMSQGFGTQSQVKEKGKVSELKVVTWEEVSVDEDMIEMLKENQCFPIIFKLDGERVSCVARLRIDKSTYTSELIIDRDNPLNELMAKKRKHLDKICRKVAKKIVSNSPHAREIIRCACLSKLRDSLGSVNL